MTFARRPLSAPDTLGERLRQLREERRLSLEELGQMLSIAPKYLRSIEMGQYRDLPGLVYARNFIKRYAGAMKLPEESALARFEEEYQVVQGARRQEPKLVPKANTDFPWYVRHSRFLLASVAVVIVLVYVVWELVNLISPPLLNVTNPAADMATTSVSVSVTGKTDPEAQVKINNQAVEVTNDGQFEEQVQLQLGLNTLKITAVRKYSRTAIVERRVLVEQKTQ